MQQATQPRNVTAKMQAASQWGVDVILCQQRLLRQQRGNMQQY
jgi:hypothetical protein